VEVNHIIRGNALDVLKTLPDESVQATITSPPYWGALRDYQVPATVWGGDERCRHEWGEPQRAPWANSVPGPNGRKKNTAAGHWKSKEAGQFCLRCGAWQGCLGQEPVPDCGKSWIKSQQIELRNDLTDEERAYVFSELLRLGIIR
jgi:hypothetical protein